MCAYLICWNPVLIEIVDKALSLRLTSGFPGFFFGFGRHVKDFKTSSSRKKEERLDALWATVKLWLFLSANRS